MTCIWPRKLLSSGYFGQRTNQSCPTGNLSPHAACEGLTCSSQAPTAPIPHAPPTGSCCCRGQGLHTPLHSTSFCFPPPFPEVGWWEGALHVTGGEVGCPSCLHYQQDQEGGYIVVPLLTGGRPKLLMLCAQLGDLGWLLSVHMAGRSRLLALHA